MTSLADLLRNEGRFPLRLPQHVDLRTTPTEAVLEELDFLLGDAVWHVANRARRSDKALWIDSLLSALPAEYPAGLQELHVLGDWLPPRPPLPPTLRWLYVGANLAGPGASLPLDRLPALQFLRIDWNREAATPALFEALASHCRALRFLSARECQVGDAQLAPLAALPALSSLDVYSSDTGRSEAGPLSAAGVAAALAALPLRRLSLAAPAPEPMLRADAMRALSLPHAGLCDVACVLQFAQLRALDLSGNAALGPESAGALAAALPRLRELDLGGCPLLGDAGAEALGRGARALERLRLDGSGVGEPGAAALAAHRNLQVLSLGSVPEAAAAAVLRDAPPWRVLLWSPTVTGLGSWFDRNENELREVDRAAQRGLRAWGDESVEARYQLLLCWALSSQSGLGALPRHSEALRVLVGFVCR